MTDFPLCVLPKVCCGGLGYGYTMTGKNYTVTGSAEPPEGGAATPKPKARPRGGSRKGIPNRLTSDVRSLVLAALHGVGGQEYLERQALANPVAFMSLVAKLIPTKIENPLPDTLVERQASVVEDLRQSIDAHFVIEDARRVSIVECG